MTEAQPPSPIPEEFQTLSPQLVVADAGAAIAFYQQAFGAEELYRNLAPDREAIIHCELLLGDSRFFVHDEFPDSGLCSPASYGGSSVTLHLYVDDADRWWQRAIDAGAQVTLPLEDQFWGDRYGILTDPFGHRWSIASRIEDFAPSKAQERADAHFDRQSKREDEP